MAEYVFIYTGGVRPQSEDEAERVLTAWQVWLEGMGSAVVDRGAPFGESAPLNGRPSSSLSGYSIVQAGSLDAAIEQAKGCPIFARGGGGGVEVYESLEM